MTNLVRVHARWGRAVAAVTLVMMASVGVIASRTKPSESDRNQRLDDTVAGVLGSARASNEINGVGESPITIIDSSSLEISRKVYGKLTGARTSSGKAASYPQVTLLNNSRSAVTQVLLILTNKVTGMRTRLKISNINIPPNSTYVVDPEKWMIPALIGIQPARADDQPRVISRKRVLRYDSDRVWLVGSAADLAITVGLVDQANGSRWDITHRSKVGAAQPMFGNGLRPRPVSYTPAAAPQCSCEGTVICFDDGSYVCWGTCYDCTIEDCAWCAIIGCTVTCLLLIE
jgi:hypothetical protein